MSALVKFPILKKEIRLAPSVEGRIAAEFWKFWTAGNEIYASSRTNGHLTKISIHESGQIHMRGDEGVALMSRLMAVTSSWGHALEVRFLLSGGACFPAPQDLKKSTGYAFPVPHDYYLLLNLFVSQSAEPGFDEVLERFHPGQLLWHSKLRHGREAILVGRIPQLDDINRHEIDFIRRELQPKATFQDVPQRPPYVEVRRIVCSPAGGNVLIVVPMGDEAWRVAETEGGLTD